MEKTVKQDGTKNQREGIDSGQVTLAPECTGEENTGCSCR